MKPFTFYLSSGAKASVIRKTEGRKKSPRLFFIRLRRSKTLIAYQVVVGIDAPTYCTIYRDRDTGAWVQGGELGERNLKENGDSVFEEIKKGIDGYELAVGPKGYLDIATFPIIPGGSILFVTAEGALTKLSKKR